MKRAKQILLWIVLLATVLTPWAAQAFPYKTNAIVADADDVEAIANYESFQWSLSAWDDNVLQWDFDIPVSNAVFRLLGMQDRLIYLDVVENSAITGTYHYTITTNEEAFMVYRPAVNYTNFLRDSWIITTNVATKTYYISTLPTITTTVVWNCISEPSTNSWDMSHIAYWMSEYNVDGTLIRNCITQLISRKTIQYTTNITYLTATSITYRATNSWTDVPAWGVYTQVWTATTGGILQVTQNWSFAGVSATNVLSGSGFSGWSLFGTATNSGSNYYICALGTSPVTRIVENGTNSVQTAANSSFTQSAPPEAGVVRMYLLPWRAGAYYRLDADLVLKTTSYDGAPTGVWDNVGGYVSANGVIGRVGGIAVIGETPSSATGSVSVYFNSPTTNYVDVSYAAYLDGYPYPAAAATNLFVTITNIAVVSSTPYTTSTVFGAVYGMDTNALYRLEIAVGRSVPNVSTQYSFYVNAGGYETNVSSSGSVVYIPLIPPAEDFDLSVLFSVPGEGFAYNNANAYAFTTGGTHYVRFNSLRKYYPTSTNLGTTYATNYVVFDTSNKVTTIVEPYARTNKLWSVSTSEYWRIKAYVPKEDLPPVQSYLAELLAYGSTWTGTPTRSLAKGKVNVTYSLYDETEGAAWTNPAIGTVIGPPVHTLTDPSGWPFIASNQMGSGLAFDGTQWNVTGTSVAEVAYGVATNTAYRGDWGAAVSNTADAAYTSATGAAATAASAYTAATQAQATADAAATGTPVYVESDPVWAAVSNATAVAIAGKLGTSTWAVADSTTNYAERTIWGGAGITFGGINKLSVEDNQLYGSWGVGELTVGTNLHVGGVVTGGLFVGDGSGLTNLPAGGSGATQLLINVSGGAVSTSTISGAILTVADMDSPAGADLSGLSNNVLSAWATASNALGVAVAGSNLAARVAADFDGSSNSFLKAETYTGTWNETNYIVQSQIHIANLGTYTVTRASGAGAYIDLTNAAQAINFDADTVSTAGKFGWALDYLGTNALTLVVTNTGAVVQPTALSLTNGAGVILFVKPQGSQTIRAYQ